MLDDDDFLVHLLLSIVIKAIPCYILFCTGIMRYFYIKNDGVNLQTKYSRLTRSKLFLSYAMGGFYVLPIICGILPINSFWLYKRWYYGFLNVVFSASWVGLAFITRMEHKRNLVNEWYCHYLFYGLNLVFVLGCSVAIIAKNLDSRDHFDFIDLLIILVEFGASISINIMMLMTNKHKRRLLEKKDGSPSFEVRSPRKTSISFKESPIQVFLDLSLNNDDFINFSTVTEKNRIKVKRSFNEFIDIENYLREYMQYTFPERIQDIPILDKAQLGSLVNISFALEKKFKNLQVFLQALAAQKYFWSREVLTFLGLESEELQTNFLAQHDKYLQNHKMSVITESITEDYDKSEEQKLM